MGTDDNTFPPRRSDGEQTHEAILEAAMRIASTEGLAGLTIGRLAKELEISKSGVYAHFRSKARLQQETIEAAARIYECEVLSPGLAAPEGLGQLKGLCEAYLSYVERGVFPGGCFFAQMLAEFDAQTGPVHDAMVVNQRGWLELLETLARKAQDKGELSPAVDVKQLAFELQAALELANYLSVLYRDQGFVERGRRAIQNLLARAAR